MVFIRIRYRKYNSNKNFASNTKWVSKTAYEFGSNWVIQNSAWQPLTTIWLYITKEDPSNLNSRTCTYPWTAVLIQAYPPIKLEFQTLGRFCHSNSLSEVDSEEMPIYFWKVLEDVKWFLRIGKICTYFNLKESGWSITNGEKQTQGAFWDDATGRTTYYSLWDLPKKKGLKKESWV